MAVKLSAAQARVFEEVRAARVFRSRDGWVIGDQNASGADKRILGRAEVDGLLLMRSAPHELGEGELMRVELSAAALWALRGPTVEMEEVSSDEDRRSERDRALDALSGAARRRIAAVAAEDEALLAAAAVTPKITLREMASKLEVTEEGVRKRLLRLHKTQQAAGDGQG